MKLFISVVLLFLTSCSSGDTSTGITTPSHSKKVTVILKDTLGSVTVTVPSRYDTFLVWSHHSDCSRCGSEKYRFQPKVLPVYKESGWIWNDRIDSVDQLTIEHPQYIVLGDSVADDAIKQMQQTILAGAIYDPIISPSSFVWDTVQTINGKQFSIITSEHYNDSSKLYSKAVWGTTLVRGNRVQFKFTLLTHQKDSVTDNFVANSKELLKQIKVNGL